MRYHQDIIDNIEKNITFDLKFNLPDLTGLITGGGLGSSFGWIPYGGIELNIGWEEDEFKFPGWWWAWIVPFSICKSKPGGQWGDGFCPGGGGWIGIPVGLFWFGWLFWLPEGRKLLLFSGSMMEPGLSKEVWTVDVRFWVNSEFVDDKFVESMLADVRVAIFWFGRKEEEEVVFTFELLVSWMFELSVFKRPRLKFCVAAVSSSGLGFRVVRDEERLAALVAGW